MHMASVLLIILEIFLKLIKKFTIKRAIWETPQLLRRPHSDKIK